MTNFSHWAYWTESKNKKQKTEKTNKHKKKTWSFQVLGTLRYLKIGRSKSVFLYKECLCGRNHGEKEWARKVRPALWISQRFRMGRTSSVLCLSKEHVLINLRRDRCSPQWQKPSWPIICISRARLGWLVFLCFSYWFVENIMQKWLIAEQTQFSFFVWSGSGEIKMPSLNYETMSRCSD